MRGDMRRAEHPEFRQYRSLILQADLLAIAESARGAGERSHLGRGREQAYIVGHGPQRTGTGPEALDTAGIALVARESDRSQGLSRVLRVVRIGQCSHRRLIGQDEDIAQAGELLGDRRNVVVADQDVLVLFLHQLIAGRHDDLNDVLAVGQHRRSLGERVQRVRIRHTDLAVGARGTAGSVDRSDAGETVHTVVRRRLYLVEVVQTVVALELRIVRQRPVTRIQPLRRIVEGEVERIRSRLTGAIHVRGRVIGAESLCPIVPAGGPGGIYQSQRLRAVRRCALLVKVDRDAWNIRCPACVQEQRRIVKRPRGGIRHLTVNTAILAGRKRYLAEFHELIFTDESLPAFGDHGGGVDAARRASGTAASGRIRQIVGALAVRGGAVVSTRDAQCCGQRDRGILLRIGQGLRDGGISRPRVPTAVGRSAGVVHHVHAALFVASQIRIHDVPVEQRENLVVTGFAAQIRVVEIRIAAVAVTIVRRDQRQTRLAVVPHAVAIHIDVSTGGHIGVPLLHCKSAGRIEVEVHDLRGAARTRDARNVDGGRKAVDDLIVPLVEYGDAPAAVGHASQLEVPAAVALGEYEVLGVGIAQADVALSEAQGAVVTAAVQPLIGRTTLPHVDDSSLDRVLAVSAGQRGAREL